MGTRKRWRRLLIPLIGALLLLGALWSQSRTTRREKQATVTEPATSAETTVESEGAPPRSRAPDTPVMPTQPGRPARLHGLVSGRYGGIWGVRVTATESGSGRILVDTGTGTNGRYELELDAPVRFDLKITPGPGTRLDPVTHKGIYLDPGESRQLDFPLASGFRVKGQLKVLGESETVVFFNRLRIFAFRVEDLGSDATRADLHLAQLGDIAREGAEVRLDRFFELRGLTPGKWRLVLDSDRWMFATPTIVKGAVSDGLFDVVRACSCFAIIEDFATEDRVSGLRARIVIDDRPIAPELTGVNGVLAYRAPAKGANMSEAELVVDAAGYETRRVEFPVPTAHRVRLLPVTEPNVTLVLKDWTGDPYEGPLRATLDGEAELELIPVSPGQYGLGVPVCPLDLLLDVPDSPFETEAILTLPETRPAEVEVQVQVCGSIRVLLQPGHGIGRARLTLYGPRETWNKDCLFARTNTCDRELEPGKELTLDPVPPGWYRVHVDSRGYKKWSTAIDVRPCERTSLVVPPLQRSE